MDGFDPRAFGRRLNAQMQEQGWTLKDLQESVAEQTRGARGTSYGSFWSYVQGRAPLEPRREVVDAIAATLGVRPDYLLFGGPQTDDEAAIRDHARSREGVELVDTILATIPGLEELDYVVATAFLTHLRRWTAAHVRAGYQVEIDDVHAYAQKVWAHLHWPFEHWKERIGGNVSIDALGTSDYLVASLTALNLSLHLIAPAGLTAHDVAEDWPALTDTTAEDSNGSP